MTRQNVTDGVREILTKTCPTCEGEGVVLSEETVAIEVDRWLRDTVVEHSQAEAFLIRVNPKVAGELVGNAGLPGPIVELEQETERNFHFEGTDALPIDYYEVVLEGSAEEVAERALPFREGEEVLVLVEEPHMYNEDDAVAKLDGYIVSISGAASLVGERTLVRIEQVGRSAAQASLVNPPEGAASRTAPTAVRAAAGGGAGAAAGAGGAGPPRRRPRRPRADRGRPLASATVSRSTVAALYALVVLIWSSTWVAIKIGLEDCPALLGAGIRFAAAGLVLLAFTLLRRRSLRTDVLLAIVLGLLPFAGTYGLVYWGEQYIPSGLTAVLFGVMPLYTALLAASLLDDEPLRARLLVGVAIAIGGLALAFAETSRARRRASVRRSARRRSLLSPLGAACGNVSIRRRGARTRRGRAQRLGDARRRSAAARRRRRCRRTGVRLAWSADVDRLDRSIWR